MEREEMGMTLPEDLVERILAMVPFPYIFKARVLSKSWLVRLSPISSQEDDQEKKHLAISFQKRIREYSSKWKTFAPAFVGKEDLLFAYDRASHHWRNIPTLSFFPKNLLMTRPRHQAPTIVDMEGALVLINNRPNDLCVANVLTRSWKRLPPAPNMDRRYPGKLVSDTDTYKMIELYKDAGHFFAQIYDSQLSAWSIKRLDIPGHFQILGDWGDGGRGCLNGVAYWVVCLSEMAWGLLAFNVKEETFKVLQMLRIDIPLLDPDMAVYELVVCNDSLVLLVYDNGDDYPTSMTVLNIDLVSRRWREVTRGPPSARLDYDYYCHEFCKGATSDGDSIYHMHGDFVIVQAYDMQKDEWRFFPVPRSLTFHREYAWEELYDVDPFSFQPGLNPFVAP